MSKSVALSWSAETTPKEFTPMLRALGEAYPIAEGGDRGAIRVAFAPGAVAGAVEVTLSGGRATIRYDAPCRAARGLGALLAGLVGEGGYRESTPFTTFGIMLDCSRNAVMTVGHFKKWLRQLALLGYNMAMLYTEDTYELPGEEYFGYLRGRYTADELKEIDDYAASLGIEMIGCIQTLGHLAQILKWPAYGDVRDTASVLLAEHEPTYALIDKMVERFSSVFRSRRLHVGMDEAHDLGNGKYADLHGHKRQFDIFNAHLARVVEICNRRGVRPLIWSDMYFRMGSKEHDYYDVQSVVPDDVRQAIPRDAELVYWDYYHDNEEFYRTFIRKHRELGFEPVIGSGVWTWGKSFWYGRENTVKNATPCIRACRQEGVKDFFFTLWGDDGGYCEYDSSLAGLAYGAEHAYCGDGFDAERLKARFAAVCGADYELVTDLADMDKFVPSGAVMWDDPLLGIYWKDHKLAQTGFWPDVVESYEKLLDRVMPHAAVTEPIDFSHASCVLRCLLAKVMFGIELDKAYAHRDKGELAAVREQVPLVLDAMEKLSASFRRQWMRRNKPQGLEVIQVRLGALRERYVEVERRLDELLEGVAKSLPELDETLTAPSNIKPNWARLVTGSMV